MYVIGTSGHIDHGKTSLIKALTGVDCDRLPEEKERQMTIDIGFAGMEVPRFGVVSVIDVPGHERFIRNMVAGAWGIDLGLLVIAADDGWMPQTEDHFRVLGLLSVERIIAVITKTDLCDKDTLDLIEDDVKKRLSATSYGGADIVRISSKTGAGIDDLKRVIALNLGKLSAASDAGKPFMYIDRVFASRGHGTVVTGTLKNGFLVENDLVHIQPGRKEARVKRVESHFSAQTKAMPSQRTALNLSGVPADMLKRGSILYKTDFFTESAEILARIELLDPGREMKNNQGIEVLIGTAAVKAKAIRVSGGGEGRRFAARIKFELPWYCYPGQPFVITNPGGYRIVGGGLVLFPGYEKKHGKKAAAGLALFRDYSIEEMALFIISMRGRITRQDLSAMLPQNEDRTKGILDSLQARKIIQGIGDNVVMKDAYDSAMNAVSKAIKNRVGLNLKEVSDYTGIDIEICRLLLPVIQKSMPITEREGKFFWSSGPEAGSLSGEKKKIMDIALKNGANGLELDKLPNESMKKNVKELIKLEYLVSLDGNLIYHSSIYKDLKGKIMKLFEAKEKITVPEAKEAAGLSRKYLIPLLNRIEREGIIKRLGDFRVKV